MTRVKMISQADHEYDNRKLKAGDLFDCEPGHVELMTRLGRAVEAPQGDETTRDLGPELDAANQKYKTRDLKATRGDPNYRRKG